MFNLTLLQALDHACLNLLAESAHLIGLLLDQGGLCSDNLLVALLHIALAFLLIHLLGLDLHLMSLGILLLLGKLTLDLLQVQQFTGLLVGEGEFLFEDLAVLLKLANVTLFKGADGLLVLLLDLNEGLVPSLVEVLVLHQVSLLDFFSLTGLIVY